MTFNFFGGFDPLLYLYQWSDVQNQFHCIYSFNTKLCTSAGFCVAASGQLYMSTVKKVIPGDTVVV